MRSWYDHAVTHAQALVAIRDTLEAAPGPVSIAVVDDHGEVVACLAMDGAARDTLENARRKAYTAARSDATSTRALAEKVQGSPTELSSFNPGFSFFHGGVAAFSDARIKDARVIDGGDATVLLFTGTGTNDGPLGPLPATDRTVNLPFCEVRYWDADGRTTRAEWFYDQMSMLVQLGHMQPSEG